MECVIRGAPPEGFSGSGDGSGYGSGYGSGDGDGDGYGYGSGSGYGSGYGDGEKTEKKYWSKAIAYFATKWSAQQCTALRAAIKAGARIAFWRSDSRGFPANGGKQLMPVVPGTVEEIAGPLKLCTSHALHATDLPRKWKGERLWVVALHGEVRDDDDKLGALKREIIGECV